MSSLSSSGENEIIFLRPSIVPSPEKSTELDTTHTLAQLFIFDIREIDEDIDDEEEDQEILNLKTHQQSLAISEPYVSFCPFTRIQSSGNTVEESIQNWKKGILLLLLLTF